MKRELIISIRYITGFIFGIIMLYTSCSGGKTRRPYLNTLVKMMANTEVLVSQDRIDNYPTHEIFFQVKKRLKSIKISLSAWSEPESPFQKKKIHKVYFIVERKISLAHFNTGKKAYIFTEIGRNFDYKWNRKRQLVIKSGTQDPLKIIDKKSLYRIRFTTFIKKKLIYRITIQANSGITLLKTL